MNLAAIVSNSSRASFSVKTSLQGANKEYEKYIACVRVSYIPSEKHTADIGYRNRAQFAAEDISRCISIRTLDDHMANFHLALSI